jgi:hypothetical protein
VAADAHKRLGQVLAADWEAFPTVDRWRSDVVDPAEATDTRRAIDLAHGADT